MAKNRDLFDDREEPPPARGAKKGGDSDGYTAKDIEVLEGLEPVRRRPGMYIGGTDERALHHLAAEVLDNAMDEAVAGHASRIEIETWVRRHLSTDRVKVTEGVFTYVAIGDDRRPRPVPDLGGTIAV